MAWIERAAALTAIELTPGEAGHVIAHLGVALGGVPLPHTQRGSACSVETATGRIVLGVRADPPTKPAGLDWERSSLGMSRVVQSVATIARPSEDFAGIRPMIYLDAVGWTLRCERLGLDLVRLEAETVEDAECEAMGHVRTALRTLLSTAERFR